MEFSIPPRAARIANGRRGEERWVVYAYIKGLHSPRYNLRTGAWVTTFDGVNPNLYTYGTQDEATKIAGSYAAFDDEKPRAAE